jgi:hypothetical protein
MGVLNIVLVVLALSRNAVGFVVPRAQIRPTFMNVLSVGEGEPIVGETTDVPEVAAAAVEEKKSVERERFTLFVGNLPFGTYHTVYSNNTKQI